MDGPWENVWEAKVPGRVKMTLWQLLRGCLPTRYNLGQRGVPCIQCCPHCEIGVEEEQHIFFGCQKSRQVWEAAGMLEVVDAAVQMTNNYKETVFQLLKNSDEQRKTTAAMLLWSIWKRRNEKLWNNNDISALISTRLAMEYLHNWKAARLFLDISTMYNSSVAVEQEQTQQRWQRPNAGRLKCNVDAAIFKEQQ